MYEVAYVIPFAKDEEEGHQMGERREMMLLCFETLAWEMSRFEAYQKDQASSIEIVLQERGDAVSPLLRVLAYC